MCEGEIILASIRKKQGYMLHLSLSSAKEDLSREQEKVCSHPILLLLKPVGFLLQSP